MARMNQRMLPAILAAVSALSFLGGALVANGPSEREICIIAMGTWAEYPGDSGPACVPYDYSTRYEGH